MLLVRGLASLLLLDLDDETPFGDDLRDRLILVRGVYKPGLLLAERV